MTYQASLCVPNHDCFPSVIVTLLFNLGACLVCRTSALHQDSSFLHGKEDACSAVWNRPICFLYFRHVGKRYHSHMAGVYCIVICKDAAGRAFSFSSSFSSLLCLLFSFSFSSSLFSSFSCFSPSPSTLLFLASYASFFLFLLLLLLFCPLPPAFSFFFSLWQPLTTNSAEKNPKTRRKNTEKEVGLIYMATIRALQQEAD